MSLNNAKELPFNPRAPSNEINNLLSPLPKYKLLSCQTQELSPHDQVKLKKKKKKYKEDC